jgi:hypothetical protein
MGDRGNVVIRGRYGDVWLYTHSCGTDLKDIVQKALARKQRWDDEAYLARIVFSEMLIHADDLSGEYGFGISTHMCDNEHGIIVLDVPNQKVVRLDENQLFESACTKTLPSTLDYRVSRAFEQYAKNGFKYEKAVAERRKSFRRIQTHDGAGMGRRRSITDRRKG